jgi:integrase
VVPHILKFKKSYYLRYVKTQEFKDRDFPLVFTPEGKINYALLLFIKNEYALGGGKPSSLKPVIDVVSDMLVFFESQPGKQQEWLTNPTELLYAYFDAKLNGTVDAKGSCELSLYWKKSKISSVRKLLSSYIKFEKFAHTYMSASLSGIDKVLIDNARTTRAVEPLHKGLLAHLDEASYGDSNYIIKGGRLNFTSENYDNSHKSSKRIITKFFPPNELTQFIKSDSNINYQAAYILQAFTGLRGSEILHILIHDVVPSNDGLVDIIVSDNQVNGNTYDHEHSKPIKRKDILGRHVKTISETDHLDDFDIEFLLNPIPRCMIPNTNNKYFSGDKTMTLQVSHPQHGYVLSWSNENARVYFTTKLLPSLLKQKRVAGHPWLLCLVNGCPLTLSAYRQRFGRQSFKSLGIKLQPHSLRHFCGFYLSNGLGIALQDIKVFMRHADINNTARYAQPTAAKVRASIAQTEYTEFSHLSFRELME